MQDCTNSCAFQTNPSQAIGKDTMPVKENSTYVKPPRALFWTFRGRNRAKIKWEWRLSLLARPEAFDLSVLSLESPAR